MYANMQTPVSDTKGAPQRKEISIPKCREGRAWRKAQAHTNSVQGEATMKKCQIRNQPAWRFQMEISPCFSGLSLARFLPKPGLPFQNSTLVWFPLLENSSANSPWAFTTKTKLLCAEVSKPQEVWPGALGSPEAPSPLVFRPRPLLHRALTETLLSCSSQATMVSLE